MVKHLSESYVTEKTLRILQVKCMYLLIIDFPRRKYRAISYLVTAILKQDPAGRAHQLTSHHNSLSERPSSACCSLGLAASAATLASPPPDPAVATPYRRQSTTETAAGKPGPPPEPRLPPRWGPGPRPRPAGSSAERAAGGQPRVRSWAPAARCEGVWSLKAGGSGFVLERKDRKKDILSVT